VPFRPWDSGGGSRRDPHLWGFCGAAQAPAADLREPVGADLASQQADTVRAEHHTTRDRSHGTVFIARDACEPGWLEAAYSLLSQITHSTPIGHLHTVRFRDGIWPGNELSPEMLSVALDAACLGSAHLIGISAVLLTDVGGEALQYRQGLVREAAMVHNAARFVHGLD
jgi:hypothetical protein